MKLFPAQKEPCPRCGGDCPRRAKLRELTVPFDRPGFYATHWVMCLALDEPVLMGIDRMPPRYPVHVWNGTTTGTTGATVSIEFGQ